VVGDGDEILERVDLIVPSSVIAPALALLGTTADVRNGIDEPAVDQGE
jgi:hypothetical protein